MQRGRRCRLGNVRVRAPFSSRTATGPDALAAVAMGSGVAPVRRNRPNRSRPQQLSVLSNPGPKSSPSVLSRSSSGIPATGGARAIRRVEHLDDDLRRNLDRRGVPLGATAHHLGAQAPADRDPEGAVASRRQRRQLQRFLERPRGPLWSTIPSSRAGARPLGGRHAGGRDDQLHRQDRELRPVHAARDRDGPDAASDRAAPARRRGQAPLRVHHRRPGELHAAVYVGVSAAGSRSARFRCGGRRGSGVPQRSGWRSGLASDRPAEADQHARNPADRRGRVRRPRRRQPQDDPGGPEPHPLRPSSAVFGRCASHRRGRWFACRFATARAPGLPRRGTARPVRRPGPASLSRSSRRPATLSEFSGPLPTIPGPPVQIPAVDADPSPEERAGGCQARSLSVSNPVSFTGSGRNRSGSSTQPGAS